MDLGSQHRHIAKLQRGWAANAKRDMKYNINRAAIERKTGNIALANAYAKEAKWDLFWMQRRLRIARKNSR